VDIASEVTDFEEKKLVPSPALGSHALTLMG